MCVCACVRTRERERERDCEVDLYLCMYMCERRRERVRNREIVCVRYTDKKTDVFMCQKRPIYVKRDVKDYTDKQKSYAPFGVKTQAAPVAAAQMRCCGTPKETYIRVKRDIYMSKEMSKTCDG